MHRSSIALACLASLLLAARPSSALAQSAPAAASPTPAVKQDVVTPGGAVWRSLLVPGWGQRYKGESRKGWIFTGIAAGLLAGTIGTAAASAQARSHYDGLSPTASDATFNGAYNRSVQATVSFEFFGAATAAFWTANLADSAFTPVDYVRIKDAHVRDVFPSLQKFYASHPLVTISLENRSAEPVTHVRVTFEAKDVMTAPAQSDVLDAIPAGLARSIDVSAAFDDRVFDVARAEAREVPAKLTIDYEVGRKKKTMTQTATFTIYGRNAIVWDDARKLASFVTPRDESVRAFVGTVASRHLAASSIHGIAQAAALFDAMGADGIGYLADPTTPFSYFEGNAEAVDSVNYPRETLQQKAGDCDDLSSLYASLLEGAGIRTALADVPGHVYVMFDSGVAPDELREYLGGDAGFLDRDGEAWIPVEITAVGKPFDQAWSAGAAETKKWGAAGKLNVLDTEAAQTEFAPAPPAFPPAPSGLIALDEKKLAAANSEDTGRLASTEAAALARRIADIKSRHLPPAQEWNEIGIAYARDGKNADASAAFSQAIRTDPTLAKAYNNLGTLAYLQGNLDGALAQYSLALSRGGDSGATLIDMATIYFEKGDATAAKDFFVRAVKIDPAYEREHPELQALLHAGVIASSGSAPHSDKAALVGADLDPRRVTWTR